MSRKCPIYLFNNPIKIYWFLEGILISKHTKEMMLHLIQPTKMATCGCLVYPLQFRSKLSADYILILKAQKWKC